ncbi:unnamed protein product [Prorocentrum cordatum]|uniref:Queuosine salvage protein n=1 Tax=Prorocentrum cordatum TaxID=2364126 RepID=A0ABN9RKS1_9DINO|nr:unnamed protein product [Polarella glacialis]
MAAVKRCTSPGAVQALGVAAAHLSNLTYVAGRVTASGADILNELADAVAALRDGSYPLFGQHLGKAGRKALLSNDSASELPEGKPTEEQIVNVSAGIIQGFFGEGFEMDITSEHKVSTFPFKKMMKYFQGKMRNGTSEGQPAMDPIEQQLDGGFHIHIDLHTCVHKNLDFFQSALFGAWYIFARSTTNLMHVTQVPVLLSSVMRELPQALERCGVSQDQVRMLEDSVLSLQRVYVNVETPDVSAGYNETIKALHQAAQHWDDLSWFEFGEDLGGLLLEFVLDGFPELYSVGPTGRLLKLEEQITA